MSLQKMVPIPGLEGLYSATSEGEIFSHRSLRYLKRKKHANNYYVVCVVDSDGEVHDILVHRLVCLAFHGYPKIWQTDVNHIDCDKSNNRPENLEWCTRKQNMQSAIKSGIPIGKGSRGGSNQKVPVVGCNDSGDVVEAFMSISDAAKAGYNNVSISYRSSGVRTSGGLHWRRASQEEINAMVDEMASGGTPSSSVNEFVDGSNGKE